MIEEHEKLRKHIKKRLVTIISQSGGGPEDFGIRAESSFSSNIKRNYKVAERASEDQYTIYQNGAAVLNVSAEQLIELAGLLQEVIPGIKKTHLRAPKRTFWSIIRSAIDEGVYASDLGITILDARRAPRVLYRNPKTMETWNGLGREPAWFTDLISKGVKAKDLIVKKLD